ncbi:MAG: putative HAD superfamily phosphohydrolase YqeG [Pseudohongiellaceae bacterium]|jgi:predicted HAD superfamily phosphohydrolase YqeG
MADWTSTVRQSLPQLVRVLRHMRPTFHAASITQVTPGFLSDQQIELILWDVDGTLGPWHCSELAQQPAQAWAELMGLPGVSHVILSNCGDARWLELGQMFPEIPVLRGFQSAAGPVLQQLLGGTETWLGGEPGGGPTSTLRKPSAELVQLALAAAHCSDPKTALMIGDQYLTDVAGASMAGALSLKLPTMQRGTFPFAVRLLQRMEDILYPLFHGGYDRSDLPASDRNA